jgi:hypothetical protein
MFVAVGTQLAVTVPAYDLRVLRRSRALAQFFVRPTDEAFALTVRRAGQDPAGDADRADLVIFWQEAPDRKGADYSVYEGALGDFTSHVPSTCTTDGTTTVTLTPEAGSRFFLVVPHDEAHEGSYGSTSTGAPRAPSAQRCLPPS